MTPSNSTKKPKKHNNYLVRETGNAFHVFEYVGTVDKEIILTKLVAEFIPPTAGNKARAALGVLQELIYNESGNKLPA